MPSVKTTTLRPIVHKDAYTALVRRDLDVWLNEAIFAPLLIVLADHGISVDEKYQAIRFDEFGRENAPTTALELALESGQVLYADGVFSGKFSAAISRELRDLSAHFSAGGSVWRIAQENIPLDLRGILARASERSAAASADILATLTQIQANLAIAHAGIDYAPAVDAIVSDLGRQFISTTAQVSRKTIGITPEIDAGMRATLNRELTENLDLAVKNFAVERIPEMRRRVEENVFQFGARSDRLAKILEAEFGICKRKAEFLADQEIGLLTAKYREARYKELGIEDYIWSTSKDRRVRETHRALEGRKCTFAHGANVSEPGTPARYLNPGEDWRCRCVPRPVVNIVALLEAA